MLGRNILTVLVGVSNFLNALGGCPTDRDAIDNFEVELHEDLFCAYSSTFRPVKDYRSTVNVKVQLAITYISFDGTEEIFTVHAKISMTWRDEFLTWDPFNYGGIKEIPVDSLYIWTPRLSLYNSDASTGQYDVIYTTCLLQYNGTVICSPHESPSGLCRTWLRNWPYDKQNCTFVFGSWMHTGEKVNFDFAANRAIVYENFDDGPGWKLLNISYYRLPGNYGPNESHPSLNYVFELQREARGLEAMIVIPSIVLIVLTTISLLLDVKEDKRLALQCFSLYGHFMFLIEITMNIPKQSLDTPIILLLIRDSAIMSSASIVLTMVLTPLRERAETPPSWLLKLSQLVTSGPGKYIVFTEFDSSDTTDKSPAVEQDKTQLYNASVWLSLANTLNSISFIIYIVTYIILICIYIPEN
ncbi:unnamed protein product [Diatraea saccharalis]|uniref:Neurotransmitter-gated ion-channel ligand-binding domain-containing protein n=1 Tax=Diatraea saccharalis TaxID=40085 RepID=A0A9N9QTM8_9NEOP|nr:unnamed protein product [Diatraea saccharalis]